MTETFASSRPSRIEIEAVVIRADGRREDLGIVACWHRSPFRRAAWRLRRAFGSLLMWLRHGAK